MRTRIDEFFATLSGIIGTGNVGNLSTAINSGQFSQTKLLERWGMHVYTVHVMGVS